MRKKLINPRTEDRKESDLLAYVNYLHSAHEYFLTYRLPALKTRLYQAIDAKGYPDVLIVVMRFFDDYVAEVEKHMRYEEEKVFPYVRQLVKGIYKGTYSIEEFGRHHEAIDSRLNELRDILAKYYKGKTGAAFQSALEEIFACAEDLRAHNKVEDAILIPMVEAYAEKNGGGSGGGAGSDGGGGKKQNEAASLSRREKDIIHYVVKGLANKQIADKLCISLHTVLTHRRNIASKLNIHSTAGLTVYAIVNKLVKLEELE